MSIPLRWYILSLHIVGPAASLCVMMRQSFLSLTLILIIIQHSRRWCRTPRSAAILVLPQQRHTKHVGNSAHMVRATSTHMPLQPFLANTLHGPKYLLSKYFLPTCTYLRTLVGSNTYSPTSNAHVSCSHLHVHSCVSVPQTMNHMQALLPLSPFPQKHLPQAAE